MDIIYSTGLKPHLIKSYKDVDGKTRSGVRIWGWRLIQMVYNPVNQLYVVLYFLQLSLLVDCKHLRLRRRDGSFLVCQQQSQGWRR